MSTLTQFSKILLTVPEGNSIMEYCVTLIIMTIVLELLGFFAWTDRQMFASRVTRLERQAIELSQNWDKLTPAMREATEAKIAYRLRKLV